MLRNRAALTNLVLWDSAKQWPSHGFITNTQTNFQMKEYPWSNAISKYVMKILQRPSLCCNDWNNAHVQRNRRIWSLHFYMLYSPLLQGVSSKHLSLDIGRNRIPECICYLKLKHFLLEQINLIVRIICWILNLTAELLIPGMFPVYEFLSDN